MLSDNSSPKPILERKALVIIPLGQVIDIPYPKPIYVEVQDVGIESSFDAKLMDNGPIQNSVQNPSKPISEILTSEANIDCVMIFDQSLFTVDMTMPINISTINLNLSKPPPSQYPKLEEFKTSLYVKAKDLPDESVAMTNSEEYENRWMQQREDVDQKLLKMQDSRIPYVAALLDGHGRS